jgi:protoheme IX farnesyltransferase
LSLVIFTALVGMAMAPVNPARCSAFASLLAIAVGAGASGALNMWYDADIDAKMRRTMTRPVAAGRIAPENGPRVRVALAVGSVAFSAWSQSAGRRRSSPSPFSSMPSSTRCG